MLQASSGSSGRLWCAGVMTLVLVSGISALAVTAQERGEPAQGEPVPDGEGYSPAPAKVDVNPVARDEEIGQRIRRVLDATEWFTDPRVRVQDGVVFLSGQAESEELRKWAGNLARNTQDVVAVANRMQVATVSIWNFGSSAESVGGWRLG